MGKYYVYAAYGVNGELLYIGKGSGSRWKHCDNGCSSVQELNRYFFHNGEKGSIKVSKLKVFDNEEDALNYESCCIRTLKPLFNKVHNDKCFSKTKSNLSIKEKLLQDFVLTMDEYLMVYNEALINQDIEVLRYVSEKQPIVKDAFELIDSKHLLKGGVFQKNLKTMVDNAKTANAIINEYETNEFKSFQQDAVQLNSLETKLQDLGKLETTPRKMTRNPSKVQLYQLYAEDDGKTNQEMADILGVSLRTVKYWLKELRELGVID